MRMRRSGAALQNHCHIHIPGPRWAFCPPASPASPVGPAKGPACPVWGGGSERQNDETRETQSAPRVDVARGCRLQRRTGKRWGWASRGATAGRSPRPISDPEPPPGGPRGGHAAARRPIKVARGFPWGHPGRDPPSSPETWAEPPNRSLPTAPPRGPRGNLLARAPRGASCGKEDERKELRHANLQAGERRREVTSRPLALPPSLSFTLPLHRSSRRSAVEWKSER